MLGAIIGDIVGSRFEFNPLQSEEFELFTPDCDFTDDTVCTIAVADALMNNNCEYTRSLVKWCRKYRHPKGAYGASFARWIDHPIPYNSYGNGAVMRISPIGLLLNDLHTIEIETIGATNVSHSHHDSLRYAYAINAATYELKHGKPKEEVIKQAMVFLGIDELPPFVPFSNPFNETIYNCVPVAFSCLLASHDFESAIRNAMIMGGDVDTIGACVGGMAEALYGIPDALRDRAMEYLPKDMIAIVEQFYERYDYEK